jgi:hypothetical protein
LKVKGFWQKKSGDNDNHSSFVAKVTGIGYDPERDRETLTLNFDEVYSEIEWTGKKGFKSRRNQDLVFTRGDL